MQKGKLNPNCSSNTNANPPDLKLGNFWKK